MRHTDPRLTNVTYMDESLLPVADELYSMPWIPDPNEQPGEERPTAISLPETDTQRPEESQTNDRIGDLTQPAEVAVLVDAAPTNEADDHHVCAANMRQTLGARGQKGARGGKTGAMDRHVDGAREFESVETQRADMAGLGSK